MKKSILETTEVPLKEEEHNSSFNEGDGNEVVEVILNTREIDDDVECLLAD